MKTALSLFTHISTPQQQRAQLNDQVKIRSSPPLTKPLVSTAGKEDVRDMMRVQPGGLSVARHALQGCP